MFFRKCPMLNYTYIVRCSDGSYYCGWTNDIQKRLASHNSGKGGKYTHSRYPVVLVYLEGFETKEEAMSREWHIKKLSHSQKEELIVASPYAVR
jgi:putative endonuclease